MSVLNRFVLAGTSPASASTAAGTQTVSGLGPANALSIIASLVGATGGTLDIYLQTSYDGGTTWVDFAHFPQLASGAVASVRAWHVTRNLSQTTLTTVGTGTSPAITANSIVGGCWGDQMRLLFVAGASTSAGAAISIDLLAHFS